MFTTFAADDNQLTCHALLSLQTLGISLGCKMPWIVLLCGMELSGESAGVVLNRFCILSIFLYHAQGCFFKRNDKIFMY